MKYSPFNRPPFHSFPYRYPGPLPGVKLSVAGGRKTLVAKVNRKRLVGWLSVVGDTTLLLFLSSSYELESHRLLLTSI